MHFFNAGVLHCQDTGTWLYVNTKFAALFFLSMIFLVRKPWCLVKEGSKYYLIWPSRFRKMNLTCQKKEFHMSCNLDVCLQTFRLGFFLANIKHQHFFSSWYKSKGLFGVPNVWINWRYSVSLSTIYMRNWKLRLLILGGITLVCLHRK